MSRRDFRETIELIVAASIISYAVTTCNKRVSEYQYKNGQEYIKQKENYKK